MASNYKVNKIGAKREFTATQTQALRALYGYAQQLVRNASGPAIPELPETERIVQGGDFIKLVKALERVRHTMKEN